MELIFDNAQSGGSKISLVDDKNIVLCNINLSELKNKPIQDGIVLWKVNDELVLKAYAV